MNSHAQNSQRNEGLDEVRFLRNLRRVAPKMFAALALGVALFSGNEAKAVVDSFFDVYVELSESGSVVMVPKDTSQTFPFPPPPLTFPDLPAPTTGTFDTEILSMDLVSSGPVIVGDPDPQGTFQVDSFFDVVYDLRVVVDGGSPQFVVDSFFDVTYSMSVTPGPGDIDQGTGDETRTWDTEIIAMDLMTSNTLGTQIFGDPDFDVAFGLLPAHNHHGHVTILKIAAPGGGGEFNIDSFFDVFVEISLEGGGFSPPTELGAMHLESNLLGVPEPSSLLLAGLGLLSLGMTRRRRRR